MNDFIDFNFKDLQDITIEQINTKIFEILGDIDDPKILDSNEFTEILIKNAENKTFEASIYLAMSIFKKLNEKNQQRICDPIDFYVYLYMHYLFCKFDLGYKVDGENVSDFIKDLLRKTTIYTEQQIILMNNTFCQAFNEIKEKKIFFHKGEYNSLFFVEKISNSINSSFKNDLIDFPLVGDYLRKFKD